MRGSGAMCLLRKSWRVFLAHRCTALRCPWVSALVLPVVRVPSCARGPPGVLFNAHVQQNCAVLQFCRYRKTTTTTNEPRSIFHLRYRISDKCESATVYRGNLRLNGLQLSMILLWLRVSSYDGWQRMVHGRTQLLSYHPNIGQFTHHKYGSSPLKNEAGLSRFPYKQKLEMISISN